MDSKRIILYCPGCRQRLRVPTDLGELILTCPVCRTGWDWSPGSEGTLFVTEDRTRVRDPALAWARAVFESLGTTGQRGQEQPVVPADLWDEWLDGPHWVHRSR